MKFSRTTLTENLTAYVGSNFTGRSLALKTAIDSNRGTFIGGNTYSAISGFHDTVEAELYFYCHSDAKTFRRMSEVAEGFGLQSIWDQNPFSRECSGGQEAALAILCRLALNRAVLGLDICAEQLSLEARQYLYRSVVPEFPNTEVVVIDNRLSELFTSEHLNCDAEDTFSMVEPQNRSVRPEGISIEGLAFGYGKKKRVFKDCSFSFDAGIYLLTGPNGSGKSTFAKLLTGLLKPTAGKFLIGSQEIHPYRHPGSYVSYAFQDPDLQLFSSRVVSVASTPVGALLVGVFGLETCIDEHPLDLPWVLRKRLTVAAALARKTNVVVLDEPTLGQDDAFCCLLARCIRALTRRGVIIVVITHSRAFGDLLAAHEIDIAQLGGLT